MKTEEILNSLKNVIDPEIGINIVDLGLIYNVEIKENEISIDLTMTSRGCPMHQHICDEIVKALKKEHTNIVNVETNLVWEPEWSPEKMSADARKKLGWGS
ncbi:MAG: metal-sulfur cluster assembly factor [Spirochaetia bacterium]|nr:metal-sulfur cluster assembly factor [Spirochaetia bacterium]